MSTTSFDFNLPGYTVIEELSQDTKTVVYRARFSQGEAIAGANAPLPPTTELAVGENGSTVVIKLLSSAYPTYQELVNFRHQYAIAKSLNLPGILRIYSLEELDLRYALVMEDFGGVSLAKYIEKHPLGLIDVLNIAIQLADILQLLGEQRIIHKDIKPSNILINPLTQVVKLIEFSIASQLTYETQAILHPNCLEGTLAYISPEQTGRMNRGIDYRTDFYALGVTLYQLLTGKLPFAADTPLELIHCHLAQIATPIHLVNSDIPVILSQIVAKLMAKNAEDRYQSALGIKYDLNQCLQQLQQTATIAQLTIAQHDHSSRFIIPERLYGRENEVKILLNAFDRVVAGGSELMLVAGCSGIGKTAVINEVHKPITRQQGYFIKGKFDKLNRNIPLSAFIQALRDLIGQLLSENDVQIAVWKTKILTVLGGNGRSIVEVIPELAQIIGDQDPLPELAGNAAENRFRLLFQDFIQIFTTPAQPLVLFLDDLQWADLASLQLIRQLLTQDLGHLLILGAYRDNEVESAHPLILTLKELEQVGAILNTIELQSLSPEDVNQLVADTLNCDRSLAEPLSKLVDRKTYGNPFFTTQFLKALHRDRLIQFNPSAGSWQCDLSQIELKSLTDDVVKFMTQQLRQLDPATQKILKLAAFLGSQFDLQTLALVADLTEQATATVLWQALQNGLIIPLDRFYRFFQSTPPNSPHPDSPTPTFRFLHDRVQQAAYSLAPIATTAALHLNIGRLLRDRTPAAELESQLFQIINQLNRGVTLIDAENEREQLAQLNWRAAVKARTSAAYDAAMSYLQTGLELLSAECWQQQYDLSLRMHQLVVEVAYLLGDYAQMTMLMEIGLKQSQNHLDRSKFHETQILALVAQDRARAAVNYAREILPNYGIDLPRNPSPFGTTVGFFQTLYRMAGKTSKYLLALPAMSDPEKLAGYNILNIIGAAAQTSMPEMLPFITFRGIALSLRYGNIPRSSMGYIVYAFLLCEKLDRIDAGYAMGNMAVSLCHQQSSREALGFTLFLWNRFVAYRKESQRALLPLILEAYQVSLAVGDTEYAAYSLCTYLGQSYEVGQNLLELYEEAVSYQSTFLKLQQKSTTSIYNLNCQVLMNLTKGIDDPCRIVGCHFDENTLAADDLLVQVYTGIRKLELAVIFDRSDLAMEQISIVQKLSGTIDGTFNKSIICFYDAIVRLADYHSHNKYQQQNILKQVKKTCRYLTRLARFSPLNYHQKALLVTAELLRAQGKSSQAAETYDRAIVAAKASGYLQEEGFINECAAKFYQVWGKEKIAAIYMQSAYYCYARWGSKAKTKYLERHYPHLLDPILRQSEPSAFDPLVTLATITNSATNRSAIDNFDLVSIIQSAQTLTSTLEITELVQQLLQIILENSGAQTCMLALPVGDKWEIQSMATVDTPGKKLIQHNSPISNQARNSLTNNLEYPEKLIYWIKNTKTSLVFDARKPPSIDGTTAAFINDRYLLEYQPQSVFVLPISKQDRVLGVVYLEHRHTPDLFTDSKITAISFLCSQAAIALENANLYQESRQAQTDLATSRQKYYDLIQSSDGVVWEYDLTTERFSFVSDRAVELLGYPISDWLSQPNFWSNCVHPEDLDLALSIHTEAITNRQRCESEYRMITADNRIIWVYDISNPVFDRDGHVISTNGLSIDISDRKQVEIELQQTNERLALANTELIRATQLKDEFLATMSHELRTPLNAILGMSEVLQEEIFGSINQRQLKSLKTIESSGQHLLSLISDMLDVSKISAGKLELDITTVNVLHLCNSSIAFIKQQAIAKQIGLDLQLPPAPGKIAVDDRRMRQVLINLLDNAVKFTPEGGWIELCVTRSPDEDWIEFAVIDTGIGIADADLSKLFQPFVQLDSGLSRNYGGTGLGLTLTKQIVELHNGSIRTESTVGKGSCFIVRLPQTCLISKSDSDEIPVSEGGYRSDLVSQESIDNSSTSPLILLAEDNPENINVLSIFLTAKGYRTILATNGYEAIQLAQQQPPDLVLMDIQMPGMDGLEAIVWMRQQPQLAHIPIIAVTSLAMKGDLDRCLAAGATDYLSKPLPLKQLNLKIQELLKDPIPGGGSG
jgi:PAS domain S-box-containing protein